MNGLKNKIKSLFKPNPADIISPLIQADELLKIEPHLADEFPMLYSQYREILKEEHGFDLAEEIAITPAIGELTIEEHARRIVRAYHERQDSNEWYSSILEKSKTASQRAYKAYGN